MTKYVQLQPREYQSGSTATFRTVMAEVTRLFSDLLCEVCWMQDLEKTYRKTFSDVFTNNLDYQLRNIWSDTTKSLPFSTPMCNYHALSQGTLQYDVKTSRRKWKRNVGKENGNIWRCVYRFHTGPTQERGTQRCDTPGRGIYIPDKIFKMVCQITNMRMWKWQNYSIWCCSQRTQET